MRCSVIAVEAALLGLLFAFASGQNHIRLSEALHHSTFLGASESGAVHLWLTCRVRCDASFARFRGMAFVEPNDVMRQVNSQGGWVWPLWQPKVGTFPQVTIASSTTAHNFSLHGSHHETHYPMHFHGDLNISCSRDRELKVQIAGASNYYLMPLASCRRLSTPLTSSRRPAFIMVYKHVFTSFSDLSISNKVLMQGLEAQVMYHSHISDAKFVAFVTTEQLELMHKSALLSTLMSRSQFLPVLLDQLPFFTRLPWAWQVVLYNLALLLFWGKDTRIMFIDHDDFIVVPRNSTVTFDSKPKYIEIQRYNIYSSTIPQAKEPSTWGSEGLLALLHYDQRDTFRLEPKCIVNPTHVSHVDMHRAKCMFPGTECNAVQGPFHIVQVPNMFRNRWPPREKLVSEHSWRWVVEDIRHVAAAHVLAASS